MSDQAPELNEEVYDLLTTSIWYELSIGAIDFLALFVVVFIAHHLARRKVPGGLSMLVCIYLAILTGIAPMALAIESTKVSGIEAAFVFGSQISSSVFALFAAINCYRFVRASTANKAKQRSPA